MPKPRRLDPTRNYFGKGGQLEEALNTKTYLNRSQLARHLRVALATVARWVSLGKIKPDAQDGNGRELFDQSKHAAK